MDRICGSAPQPGSGNRGGAVPHVRDCRGYDGRIPGELRSTRATFRCIEQRSAFARVEFAPFPDFEISEGKLADANANQPQGWIADRRGHAPHLAVFAFDEFEREPGSRNHFSEADWWLTRR